MKKGHQTTAGSVDVSIIIPVFNGADTIGRLLRQLLSEYTVSTEIIVVDDGSADGTGDIIRGMADERIILIEQSNQGVYAARNAALAVHRGEWLLFLDADDEVGEGFVSARLETARRMQADVAVFGALRRDSQGLCRPVHMKQPYGQSMDGQAWITHAVTQREWPHYLWLQMVRSSYITEHGLAFRHGRSHKDILWTVQLALCNGRFYFSEARDYTYSANSASITNRTDYYDIRAQSYIDVIAEIIRMSASEQGSAVKRYLLGHALTEARHFLGLYRNRIGDRAGIRTAFNSAIARGMLFRGIRSASDAAFWLKLVIYLG